MISETQSIHRERIEQLREKTNQESDELAYELKKIDFELFKFGDASAKKARPKFLITLLHMAQEDLNNTINNIQMIVDELTDIEDEINRDEINNAERERMLSLP